jgi:hypothetical protein
VRYKFVGHPSRQSSMSYFLEPRPRESGRDMVIEMDPGFGPWPGLSPLEYGAWLLHGAPGLTLSEPGSCARSFTFSLSNSPIFASEHFGSLSARTSNGHRANPPSQVPSGWVRSRKFFHFHFCQGSILILPEKSRSTGTEGVGVRRCHLCLAAAGACKHWTMSAAHLQ